MELRQVKVNGLIRNWVSLLVTDALVPFIAHMRLLKSRAASEIIYNS